MSSFAPRRRDDPPDAAELVKWAQHLRALGVPAARVTDWIQAGRSRRAIVDDLRAWLKGRTKSRD